MSITFSEPIDLSAFDVARRIANNRHVETLHRVVNHKLDDINDNCREAVSKCRELIAHKSDITEAIKEMEILGNALLVAALKLRREA